MVDLATVAVIAAKTSLMIVVIGVASVVLAGKSAACRHFLWTSALALSLLMPFAIVFLPSVAVIPASWHGWASPLLSAPSAIEQWSIARVDAAGSADGVSVLPTILFVWSAGALLFLLRSALASVGLLRWVRWAGPLQSPSWLATWHRVSHEQEFARPLRVLESSHVLSPCTWGLIRPVLLLPRVGADWPESQRRHALLHELGHIRRFDYLSTFVARLACAMHWYNPLAWFAAAQVRRLQEEACDDAVLRAGETPSDYAECLLTLAAQANHLPYPARMAIGMFHRSALNGRIAAILHPHKRRSPLRFITLLAASVPVSCLMLFLAAAAAAKPPHARSSVHSIASLFLSGAEPEREEARPDDLVRPSARSENAVAAPAPQPAPLPAPSARLVPHERQRLAVLPEVAPLPALPEISPLPPVPPVPAVPPEPPVPPTPVELPVLAQLPELPVLPPLPEETPTP